MKEMSLSRLTGARALREHPEHQDMSADPYMFAYHTDIHDPLYSQVTREMQVPCHDVDRDFLAYHPQAQLIDRQYLAGAPFGEDDSLGERAPPFLLAASPSSGD